MSRVALIKTVLGAFLACTMALMSPSPAAATEPSSGSRMSSSGTTSPVNGAPLVQRTLAAEAAAASLEFIRSCMRNVRTLAGCVGTAAFAACGATFSKFLACSKKVYSAYETTKKIIAYRDSASCPQSLRALAAYVCTSRVPTAPRSVFGVVRNNGYPLRTYAGPSTFFRYAGTYAEGTRLSITCVALYGQRVYLNGRWDTAWSRLTNGLFVPRIALGPVGFPSQVPFC